MREVDRFGFVAIFVIVVSFHFILEEVSLPQSEPVLTDVLNWRFVVEIVSGMARDSQSVRCSCEVGEISLAVTQGYLAVEYSNTVTGMEVTKVCIFGTAGNVPMVNHGWVVTVRRIRYLLC